MRKVKLPNGASQRVPIRVMEMTLFETHNEFIKEYANFKAQRRAFETKRRKNVKINEKCQKTCLCHLKNKDHIRNSLNHLLLINNKPLIKVGLPPSKKKICFICFN